MEAESGGSVSVATPLCNNHVMMSHAGAASTRQSPPSNSPPTQQSPPYPAKHLFDHHFYTTFPEDLPVSKVVEVYSSRGSGLSTGSICSSSTSAETEPGLSSPPGDITTAPCVSVPGTGVEPAQVASTNGIVEPLIDDEIVLPPAPANVDVDEEVVVVEKPRRIRRKRKKNSRSNLLREKAKLDQFIKDLNKGRELGGPITHLPEYVDSQPSTSNCHAENASERQLKTGKAGPSVQCCLLEDVNGVWTRCPRPSLRPLTTMLQRMVLDKQLSLAVDQEDPNMRICVYHRRLIRYERELNPLTNRRTRKLDTETLEGPETLEESLVLDLYPHEIQALLSDSDESIDERRGGRKRRRRNGESIGKQNIREELERLDASSDPSEYSSECLACEECGLNPENPCNLGKSPLHYMIKRKRKIDPDSRKHMKELREEHVKNRKVELLKDLQDGNDEEEDDHPLAVLSAASLRKYRKHFDIPTKASATKHAMLEEVIEHLECMPVNATESVAFFLHKTRRKEDETNNASQPN